MTHMLCHNHFLWHGLPAHADKASATDNLATKFSVTITPLARAGSPGHERASRHSLPHIYLPGNGTILAPSVFHTADFKSIVPSQGLT